MRIGVPVLILLIMASSACACWVPDPDYLQFYYVSGTSGGIFTSECHDEDGSGFTMADTVECFNDYSISGSAFDSYSRKYTWDYEGSLPSDDESTFVLNCLVDCMGEFTKARAETWHTADQAKGYQEAQASVSGSPFVLLNKPYEAKSKRKAQLWNYKTDGKKTSYGDLKIQYTESGVVTWVGSLLWHVFDKPNEKVVATGDEASEDWSLNVTATHQNSEEELYSHIEATLAIQSYPSVQCAAWGGGMADGTGYTKVSVKTFSITKN